MTTGPMDPARRGRHIRFKAQLHLWQELKTRAFFGTHCHCQYALGPFVADFWLPEARTAIKLEGEPGQADAQSEWLEAWLERRGIQLLRFDSTAVLEQRAAILQSICRLVEARLKVA